jgi:hypothetical protein
MKLTELNTAPKYNAVRALREHYNIDFNLGNVSLYDAKSMLKKVQGLIQEDKRTVDYDRKLSKHSYMKLAFMEQALSTHIDSIRQRGEHVRIVFENEEVDKSQVVLAAQDMVDNVQDMIEKVSDMLVKELPALASSMESLPDIGSDGSKQFSDQATQALKALQDSLMQHKTALEGAVDIATGQGGGIGMADTGADTGMEPEQDIDMDIEDQPDGDMEADMDIEEPAQEEPEEQEPELPVGRQKR